MSYFTVDFWKMTIGFILIVAMGLVGVYWTQLRFEEQPSPADLTAEPN